MGIIINMRIIILNFVIIYDIFFKYRFLYYVDSEVSIKKWIDGMVMNFKGIFV